MINTTYELREKSNYNGATTIEKVREYFKDFYSRVSEKDNIIKKVELKAWLAHSESRHGNGNYPFTFGNYVSHMRLQDYIEQVELGVIECSDIGIKEEVIAAMQSRARVR